MYFNPLFSKMTLSLRDNTSFDLLCAFCLLSWNVNKGCVLANFDKLCSRMYC